MTGPHWATFETSSKSPNVLNGLQESICPSLNAEPWAHSLLLGFDSLVRSPSSYSEPASWDSFSNFDADSPPHNWAQREPDLMSFKSRSETFPSLNTGWAIPSRYAVQPPDHKLQCNYHNCTAQPFQQLCDFKAHLRNHSADVLRRWEEEQPCRCPWSGNCKSKAIFKSRRILQNHLDNVHITPLVCTVSGCSYRKPFRSNYDLKRHMLTAHSSASENSSEFLLCPYPKCDRDPKTFVRKDKWLIHIATCHEGTDCPINHCKAGKIRDIATHEDLMKHIREEHGKFECGLGSCALNAASRFVEAELLKHLEIQHGLPYAEINKARSAVKIASDKTIKHADLSSPWKDCKYCEETLKQKSDDVRNSKEDVLDGCRNHTLSFQGFLSPSE